MNTIKSLLICCLILAAISCKSQPKQINVINCYDTRADGVYTFFAAYPEKNPIYVSYENPKTHYYIILFNNDVPDFGGWLFISDPEDNLIQQFRDCRVWNFRGRVMTVNLINYN